MPKIAKTLTETEINEIICKYTATVKTPIHPLARMYKVSYKQIYNVLNSAGIFHGHIKKDKPIKPPEQIRHVTPEYFEYLTDLLAQAGRMDGVVSNNFQKLINNSNFKGNKRYVK